jgi:acetyltransferase-like isoleucine patch superfamily enzyme
MPNIYRIRRILIAPFGVLAAKLRPAWFARASGVKVRGRLAIYGSSYAMFGSEPFLVSLGDNVHIANGVRFVCHDGAVLPLRQQHPDLEVAAPISVGDNVFIGYGATILPGVTIGGDCIVGAGSVVTRDVPPGSVVAGNPARFVKSTADYLAQAQSRSLRIGHLHGSEKEAAYKKALALR